MWEEEERLLKETETVFASLSMREIADRDLREILFEPTELIGNFKKDEIEKIIRDVDRENAPKRAKSSSCYRDSLLKYNQCIYKHSRPTSRIFKLEN